MKTGTFWLSPAPSDTGSVGWDAALTRIATWAKFVNKEDHSVFYAINTHFDHMGDTARLESAKLIRQFIADSTEGMPVLLSGDFNCSPDDPPYQYLTSAHDNLQPLHDALMSSPQRDLPPKGTFNGFGNVENPERIDFIFTNNDWEVLNYDVLCTLRLIKE